VVGHPTIIQPAQHAFLSYGTSSYDSPSVRDSSFHQIQVILNFTVTDGFRLYTVVIIFLR
jgi:hypothetical protein